MELSFSTFFGGFRITTYSIFIVSHFLLQIKKNTFNIWTENQNKGIHFEDVTHVTKKCNTRHATF